MTHRFPVTVFYEDTDMGGIVYYANYLKFIERARSTWVEDMGVDQLAMKDAGVVFAVRRVEADYIAASQLGDRLEVRTHTVTLKAASWLLAQEIYRGDQLIFTAKVTIVAIGANGRATRLPAEVCF